MKLEVETLIPIALAGLLAATLYFNNSAPSTTPNGLTVIKPKPEITWIRGTDDIKEDDNKVTIKHIDHPNDELHLRLWHDYIVLPRGENGKPDIPTRKKADGSEEPIWSIDVTRKQYIFEPGWDFGAYAGYLDGSKNNTKVKDFDVGLRFSPLRIWNTFATDLLISNQSAGAGISFYPAPERYGEFWTHMGIGYGRVITFDDDTQRNLLYVSFSTRF